MEKDKLDFGKNIQVISAQNLEELFYFQKSVRDLYIVGAGTTKEHLAIRVKTQNQFFLQEQLQTYAK